MKTKLFAQPDQRTDFAISAPDIPYFMSTEYSKFTITSVTDSGGLTGNLRLYTASLVDGQVPAAFSKLVNSCGDTYLELVYSGVHSSVLLKDLSLSDIANLELLELRLLARAKQL